MIYLILSVVLASTFSLMMKHAHARGYGLLAVGCLNYVVAGTVGLAWVAAVRPAAVPLPAIGFGCVGGGMYVLCYLAIMAMLDRQGISVATAVTRLAIAVPIVVAMCVWHEIPTVYQAFGLLVTFAAILAFELRDPRHAAGTLWHHAWPLAGCFLTAGLARLAMKAFTHVCGKGHMPVYIAAWFGFAGLIAVGVLLVGRVRPRGVDWPFGAVLGLVNVGTLFCSMNALARLPAIVFFPASAVGSLALVVVLAGLVWGERLNRRALWGVALACAALVLVNLK